jgi:hypothetical protein
MPSLLRQLGYSPYTDEFPFGDIYIRRKMSFLIPWVNVVLAPFPSPRYRLRIPDHGALTLSDLRSPTLAIVCEPCARRGRYAVARLL